MDETQAPQLLAVVEVDQKDRVRCQAPGCGHSVYKRIHVVSEPGCRVGVYGSDCFGRLFADLVDRNARPRYGATEGRMLTPEERAMLAENTERLIAQFEGEAVAQREREAAERAREEERQRARKAERDAQVARDIAHQADRDTQARRAYRPLREPPAVGYNRAPLAGGRDALSMYRAQQARIAAATAMNRHPERAPFGVDRVARAMVQTKAECITLGLRLDDPEANAKITSAAILLLTSRAEPTSQASQEGGPAPETP